LVPRSPNVESILSSAGMVAVRSPTTAKVESNNSRCVPKKNSSSSTTTTAAKNGTRKRLHVSLARLASKVTLLLAERFRGDEVQTLRETAHLNI